MVSCQRTVVGWHRLSPVPELQTTRMEVHTKDRTFYMFCETPEATNEWVAKLREVTGLTPLAAESNNTSGSVSRCTRRA